MPPKKKTAKAAPHKKYDFTPVAMFFIVMGVIFFVLGLCVLVFPFKHIVSLPVGILVTIGGTMVMAVGYTNLELGLIRKELEK